MPELKNLFIKGKMNKDLDERLVPQGEYRDAQNIDVAFSEGSNVGAIEPIMGHTGQSGYFYNLTDAHCVGSVTDTENDKAYALVYSPSINIIVEYDIIANTKQIVLADEGSILDFSPDRLITGISVLDGVLYYTDDHTEPKQIDIEYWKSKSNLTATVISGAGGQNTITLSSDISSELNNLIAGGDVYFFGVGGVPQHIRATSASGTTVTLSANLTGSGVVANTTVIFSILYTTENLSEDRISLYKKGPLNAPTFHTLSASTRGGVGTLGNLTEIETTVIPNLSTTAIDTSISITFSVAPNYLVDDIIILKRNITVGQSTESSSARVKITAKPSSVQFTCTLLAKTDNVENDVNIAYIPILEEDEPLFELKFPRFSYRYKYTNGQYSTFAPFSVPAFLPGDFEYDAKKAYNLGMENTVRSLKLQGWITSPSTSNYEADIEEIDILYKDSVSSNVYIVESIKKSGGGFASPFEIKDEQIFKATQSNQLLRPFDSIPRKAKALEITGNRLIFGNYLQNFNYTDTPNFTIDTVPRTNSTELAQKLGLKTRRTYQFGIGFQDEYGRQTPVFTDTSGVKKLTQENADFNLQFKVATSTTPPSEATHYKYYIKETSNEYYNLVISNIYDDEEGFLYLSVPSAETNKVQTDDIIILKKEAGDVSYKGIEKKFKVIDKLNNPPDFLANVKKATYSASVFIFEREFFDDQTLYFKQPGKTPVKGYNTILIQDAGAPGETDVNIGITDNFKAEMTVGTEIRFRRAGTGQKSNIYTIKSIQYGGGTGNNNGGEFTFEEEFGDDVEVLYGSNLFNDAITRSEIFMEKVEATDDSGNPEYEGKFFIKLNNSTELKNALITDFDESLLNTVAAKNIGYVPRTVDDNRQYVLYRSSYSYSGGYLPGDVLNGVTYQAGFHIILQTERNWDDSTSFYDSDPLTQGFVEGNYIRISGGDQQIETGAELAGENALYETFATTSGTTTNSKNVTVVSATGIEVNDYVTGSGGFTQSGFVQVTAIDGNIITLSSAQSIVTGTTLRFRKNIDDHPNYKIEEALLIPGTGTLGYWLLKFDRAFEVTLPYRGGGDSSGPIAPNYSYGFVLETRSFDANQSRDSVNPPIFEVEPEEGVLDIYYETEETFPVSDLTSPIVSRTIPWSNCISFGNGVESDRIRDDFNAPTIGKGVRVSTVFEDNYKEERIKSGLIFSGIYNGKNGINRLNQFIIAENITEEANPIYGSIQKLNTRDTDLTLLCDDKILKVPAKKDLLFQADGNPQVTSTDRFLGTIIPYAGNYGCQNPESFADYTYKSYFVDKSRGKVLRLSLDGLTEISNYGMRDYINDICLSHNGYIHGSFDSYKNQYNVSFRVGSGLDGSAADKTITFSESVNGWVSFKDYIQESGFSLNNRYVTFKDGNAYRHHNSGASGLHGTAYKSSVTLLLNGNPGNIKNFRTLNYQGESGWKASTITTDKQSGNVSTFVEKEGIYYNYISGETQATKASLDLKALNVQGLGTPTSISSNDATFADLNNAIQVGDKVFNNNNSDIRTVQSISGNTITLDAPPTNAFSYFAKDNRFNTSGILGYYAEIKMETTNNVVFGNRPELYSVGSEVSLSS
jgi:hypothetical protein